MRLIYITKIALSVIIYAFGTLNPAFSQKKGPVNNCVAQIFLFENQGMVAIKKLVREHGSDEMKLNKDNNIIKKTRLGLLFAKFDLTISVENNILVYRFKSLDNKISIHASLVNSEIEKLEILDRIEIKKSTCTTFTVFIDLGISDVAEVYNSLLSNTHGEILTAEGSKALISQLESMYNVTGALDEKNQLKDEILVKRRIGSPNAQANISVSGKSNVLFIKFSPLHGQNSVSKEIIEEELKKIYPDLELDLKINHYSEFTATFDLVLDMLIPAPSKVQLKCDTTVYLTKHQSQSFQTKLIAHYGVDLKKHENNTNDILSNYRVGSPTAGAEMSISVVDKKMTIEFSALPDNSKLEKDVIERELQKFIKGFELPKVEIGSTFKIYIDLHPVFYEKEYNNALRKETNPKRWSVGVSIAGSYVYRRLSTDVLDVDLIDEIEGRNQNEYAFIVPSFNLTIGGSFRSHRTSIGLSVYTLGYQFDIPGDVDITTGLFTAIGEKNRQSSEFYSISLNYQYLSYYRELAPYFMAGLNVTYGRKSNAISNLPNSYFGTSLRSAIGLSYNPNYRWSFHFAPTGLVYWDSRKFQQINSRFYTIGFEAGAVINLPSKKPNKNI